MRTLFYANITHILSFISPTKKNRYHNILQIINYRFLFQNE